MRSGQPMTMPNSRRCKEDEKLLNCVLAREKRGYIIDTRTQNLAQSAKVSLLILVLLVLYLNLYLFILLYIFLKVIFIFISW